MLPVQVGVARSNARVQQKENPNEAFVCFGVTEVEECERGISTASAAAIRGEIPKHRSITQGFGYCT